MIRDRGRIKWNSLMLPEHVKMLREWAEEETWMEQKQLDEQKLEMLDETAAEAMELGKAVSITYFEANRFAQLTGTIHYFDDLQKEFRVIDQSGNARRISLKNIDQIRMID
ncbi:YolD-like protein [Bacillus freudenreichii]|nr:YolD-like protein [Bacillus freudenreichii]